MLTIKTKKSKIITSVVIALLLVGGTVLYIMNDRYPTQTPASDQLKQDINYDPPTEEEKKQAEDNKARLTEEDEKRKNQSQPSISNKASVTPEITIAEVSGNFVELGSFVPGIFENNGNCIAKFTRNAHTVTRQVQSVAEGRATYCPLIKIPLNEFPEKGTWQVKVSYESAAYSGSSSERNIEVK
jgi:hypothetical protein